MVVILISLQGKIAGVQALLQMFFEGSFLILYNTTAFQKGQGEIIPIIDGICTLFLPFPLFNCITPNFPCFLHKNMIKFSVRNYVLTGEKTRFLDCRKGKKGAAGYVRFRLCLGKGSDVSGRAAERCYRVRMVR
jgi:hypothetical protein